MEKYSKVKRESQFKNLVFDDYFQQKNVGLETEIGNIDFIVTDKKSRNKKDGEGAKVHYVWMEAKLGIVDKYSMITQLILTAKKVYDKNEFIPNYIGCFDTVNICFVELVNILAIYKDNDVDWTVKHNNYDDDNFIKIKNKIKKLIGKNITVFEFEKDDTEIKSFINENVIKGNTGAKFLINKNNFLNVFYKWCEAVMPTIDIDLGKFNKAGIIEGDFYLADLISSDNRTLREGLNIVLHYNHYKFQQGVEKNLGISLFAEISFTDNQKAFHQFWEKYERPPLDEYWEYIIERHDLLVPQDKRQREGKFFTPKKWVMLSQEYLEKVFGDNWQDEYYIWDCAAGTGNLLTGLTNKYNIWASDIDKSNVDIMKDIALRKKTLLEKHIFKFDFLNDDFSEIPKELKAIIDDEEKRRKLIIYINPPYGEASTKKVNNKSKKNKKGITTDLLFHEECKSKVGAAANQLYILFLYRIFKYLKLCKIGLFTSLSIIAGKNFNKMREIWNGKYLKGFIVNAKTFDNVPGLFPIGFHIWDLERNASFPKKLKFDVFNNEAEQIMKKVFQSNNNVIINWFRQFYDNDNKDFIGSLRLVGTSFQHNEYINIQNKPSDNDVKKKMFMYITKNNIIEVSIYFTVRNIFEHTWINHDDHFLSPNELYENDNCFINNCFMYSILSEKNTVTITDGTNHWIPFTEEEVNSKEKFASNFMSDFIAGKIIIEESNDLFVKKNTKTNKPMKFSKEALAVYNAGKELWIYFHQQPRINVNAGLYDIKGYFQGFSNGRMNNKSNDEKYNLLIDDLRKKLKILAKAIEPKVYEYGFLLE